MSLYELSLKVLNDLETGSESYSDSDSDSDLKADFKTLTLKLYGKLDPSIRNKIQKRGVSILQNVYTGFDTEYKNIGPLHNSLISVQLAVNTKTILKLPKYSKYELSTLDTLNNKVYKLNNLTSVPAKSFNYFKIESSINKSIDDIRLLKYKKNDLSIEVLAEGLKRLNIPRAEKEGIYIFSFPRTPIQPFIYYNTEGKGYKILDIIRQSNLIGEPHLKRTFEKLIDLLKGISKNIDLTELKVENTEYQLERPSLKTGTKTREVSPEVCPEVNLDSKTVDSKQKTVDSKPKDFEVLSPLESTGYPQKMEVKKLTRSYMSSFTEDKVSVSKTRNNYLIAHLTNADLSMMKDFEEIKENLDIVNKCFVTLGKPVVLENTNIIIRDTMLLAPAGKRSLEAIGSLYGPMFNKISLSKDQIENMDLLLKNDKTLFDNYALKDAVIPLIHSNYMEDFSFNLKELGIPITLSSLGTKYVKDNWEKTNYKGYQISPEYLLGDASKTQTPKGLFWTGQTGLKLSLYISNFKGGRNESFMYGAENETIWFDYDLTSAYTTAMAALGNPVYSKGRILSEEELKNFEFEEILYSYIIINTSFKFPAETKYPSIPCYLDETTTIYPLEGEGILTGAEYNLAESQGCTFNIKEIYYIPFEKYKDSKNKDIIFNHPFKRIIKEIQSKRVEYPKGSINNLLYKEIGNSMYGSVVRGMSDKRKFDIKTGKTIRMGGNEISNPIIAS